MKRILYIIVILIVAYGVGYMYIWNHINRAKELQRNPSMVETFLKQENMHPKMIFLGNSITEQYDLSRYYTDHQAYLNRGIGGDMTKGVLARLDEVINRNPENIILLIGVNDMSRGISQDTIIQNYTRIIKRITEESSNTKLTMVSVLPIRNTYSIQRLLVHASYFICGVRSYDINNEIRELNEKLLSLSSEKNIHFIKAHSQFTDENGNLKAEYARDNVHLNDQGYTLLTSIYKREIGFLNELSTQITPN